MRANDGMADIVAEFREMVHKSVDGIIAVKADVIAERIEAAWKRERDRLLSEPRSWEECVARAMKAKENSDELY